MMFSVILKKGRETIFRQKHHWIFSGAIASYPEGYKDGDLVAITSAQGEHLGWGFFNRGCSLSGRIISFSDEDIYQTLRSLLTKALSLRSDLLANPVTTACRLINGEGDGLPALIVDKYGPYLAVQTGALGMHKMLPFLLEYFKEVLSIEGVYDKSGAKEEGLEAQGKVLWGRIPDQVLILEEGIRYHVDIKKGQKTGFFLDQREMRKHMGLLAAKKKVLNCFCYTGGFTLAALEGGASLVDSVDISASALDMCKENVNLNKFSSDRVRFYQKDVFDYLQGCQEAYDLVILDPPAFAKKKKDVPNAIKGYKNLFKLALKKMPRSTLFLFSSCSYYISEPLFEKIVTEACLELNQSARIVGRHRQAFDHPINPFHPESAYLKSILILN